MRSRISFFNAGVAKNLLKRCWPLWAAYFAVILLSLPGSLSSQLSNYLDSPELAQNLAQLVLFKGCRHAFISFGACILAVMVMFSYLYEPRSCGMMNALPMRRETMFSTAFITGLAPLLLADLLCFAIAAVFFGRYTYMSALWTWLMMALLCDLAFYGFAVFCAMLTGSLIILPAVYALLNCAAYLAEGAVKALLGIFVYGISTDSCVFRKLSPVIELYQTLSVDLNEAGACYVRSLNMLWVYALAGAVFAAAAFLLYRRRRMETAGDVVAISILKPIFKYCMTFGAAVVFCSVVHYWFLDNVLKGPAAAVEALALLLVGAFIGYFASEMLLQKTVRVFSGKWKGFAVSCAILVVFTALSEFDAFGYERFVPDPADVESVEYVLCDYVTLKEPGNIALATGLHEALIADKAKNESCDRRRDCSIIYNLSSGGKVARFYRLAADEDTMMDSSSTVALAEQLGNVQEAIDQHCAIDFPVTPATVSYAYVSLFWVDENGEVQGDGLQLDVEEAVELYEHCIAPDIADGTLGRQYLPGSAQYYADTSNVSLSFELRDPTHASKDKYGYDEYDSLYLDLTMGALRTCAWVRERFGDGLMTIELADPLSHAVG